ncbi:hypothetical protein [Amycolatopsis sp. NPDC051128]|uniref:hypothetical protein n=1 Tax=Amycolatopsis sp. NPDC051128 TaxID=3155412 RepID=UPI00341A68BB
MAPSIGRWSIDTCRPSEPDCVVEESVVEESAVAESAVDESADAGGAPSSTAHKPNATPAAMTRPIGHPLLALSDWSGMLQRAHTGEDVPMRFVVRLFFGAVAGTLLLLAFAGNANAQSPYTSVVGLKPSSGVAGSSFTISWNFYPCKGNVIFTMTGTQIGSAAASPQVLSGTVNATVPSGLKPGGYAVTGSCTNARTGGPLTGSATFTVTGTPTTTPPRPVPTTPPPPATTTRPTRPGTTTTPPSTTTTPPPTTTTPPTSTQPATPGTPTTTTTEPKPGELVLDRPSIQPGDTLSASGKGCLPSRTVTLMSEGAEVGTAYTDSTGAFTAPVEFTRIEAGRHTVVAECGVRLTGAVDQIVTRSSGGQTGTLVILVFFVLAGITVIRFR